MQIIANRIKSLRTKRGLTLSALARKSGLSRATVNRLEAGAADCSVISLLKVAQALNTTVRVLVSRPPRQPQAADEAAEGDSVCRVCREHAANGHAAANNHAAAKSYSAAKVAASLDKPAIRQNDDAPNKNQAEPQQLASANPTGAKSRR